MPTPKTTLASLIACLTILPFQVQAATEPPLAHIVERALAVAKEQSLSMARVLADQPGRLPKTLRANGELETCDPAWWVSGFFPGVLWYLYEYDGSEELRRLAAEYSSRVEGQKHTTDNHDVGFMIFCSFGNGYRLTGDPAYREVIRTASESLSTRFSSVVGCIRSWDDAPWSKQWKYPVIIDNMMNLEMLLWAGREFGETRFTEIARSHADKTMRHHFRPDFSSFHVVSYLPGTGEVEKRSTAQGFADDSAWARGQAWGLYGYTMMYRMTRYDAYLAHAVAIADFIINHPNLPADGIPYWDFDAPDIPNALRDASAGAIICSALMELARYVDAPQSDGYQRLAETQLQSLCSPTYLAAPGENGHFILKHSVGHMPNKTEVDAPLTYADYYFVEALLRFRKLSASLAKSG